ncbi:MAG: phage tail protein [Actinobacteria bacterium]|nr:phage tail protein [Actinomycetota bacterium]
MVGPTIATSHSVAQPNASTETEMDPAVTVGFAIEIDGHKLGVFTSVDGLSFEITLEPVTEGGNNAFVHQLPGRVKYQNIKLKRPLNKDSQVVVDWFQKLIREMNQGKATRSTMKITAKNTAGDDVATWNLQGVIPVKWQGPSMSVESSKVAEETLELAHHGFLES